MIGKINTFLGCYIGCCQMGDGNVGLGYNVLFGEFGVSMGDYNVVIGYVVGELVILGWNVYVGY